MFLLKLLACCWHKNDRECAAFWVIWNLLIFQQWLNRRNIFFKKQRKWEATFVTVLFREKEEEKNTINLSAFYLISSSQAPQLQNVSNLKRLNRASRHFQPPPRSNKQNTNKCIREFFPFEMWKKRGRSVRTWNGSEHLKVLESVGLTL